MCATRVRLSGAGASCRVLRLQISRYTYADLPCRASNSLDWQASAIHTRAGGRVHSLRDHHQRRHFLSAASGRPEMAALNQNNRQAHSASGGPAGLSRRELCVCVCVCVSGSVRVSTRRLARPIAQHLETPVRPSISPARLGPARLANRPRLKPLGAAQIKSAPPSHRGQSDRFFSPVAVQGGVQRAVTFQVLEPRATPALGHNASAGDEEDKQADQATRIDAVARLDKRSFEFSRARTSVSSGRRG